jgi:hypothetical protein
MVPVLKEGVALASMDFTRAATTGSLVRQIRRNDDDAKELPPDINALPE